MVWLWSFNITDYFNLTFQCWTMPSFRDRMLAWSRLVLLVLILENVFKSCVSAEKHSWLKGCRSWFLSSAEFLEHGIYFWMFIILSVGSWMFFLDEQVWAPAFKPLVISSWLRNQQKKVGQSLANVLSQGGVLRRDHIWGGEITGVEGSVNENNL